MKKILYLIMTLSTIMAAHAQWNLQSPIPTQHSLEGAAFISPAHIFICGDDNLLLESTDAGNTWVTRMSGAQESDPFYAVYFADALHGYLTGNGTDAWRTSNGGVTWFQMTTVPGGSMYHLDFITPTIGFIGGNGSCAFTSNGGLNWVTKSAYPTCPVIFGMDFRDAQVGLVGGIMASTSDEGIYKTTNGGTSWVKKFASSANDVIWMNNTTAIATIGTSIYRSTDIGETWTEINGGITTGILDLEKTSSTNIVGVSGKGDIWRSTDGGFTWSWVFDGLGDLPVEWTVDFFDSMNGLVVGQGGLIFSSIDGGVTWTTISNGMGVQIYDLQMYSNTFGIAACNNCYVMRTTNGGIRWEVQKLEVTGQIFGRDETLRGVSIVDQEFAVVAGPGGTVFRTTDGGISWQSIGYPILPDAFWIEDVKFVNRLDGWLVGLDQDLGHQKSIYKTTDGGLSWTQAISSGGYMYSVDFTDTQHGLVTTAGASYVRTTNGGATWVQQGYPPYFTQPQGVRVDFVDQNNGWVVGWDGFVAKTINGGNSWTIVDIGTTTDHLFNVSVVSPSEVWAVGRENFSFDGVIYHTTNGGVNWTREVVTHYLPDVPYTISAFASGDVWFGGYNGRIFKKNGSSMLTLHLKALIEGFYNTTINKMVRDTIRIYLRNVTSPYSVVDSAKTILDSNGMADFNFSNAVNSIPYYIVIKHRNGLETWSAAGNSFVSGNLTYDFTLFASRAYGNNQILKGTKYCVYSGDITKDGIVDGSDLSLVDNDAFNFATGYLRTDLNGDSIIDGSDLLIGDNNANNFISVRNPIVGNSPVR